MEQKPRINAGYTIIDSISVGQTEFVLGENPKAPQPFVTWECNNRITPPCCFEGHYFYNKETATKDLTDRARDHLTYLRSIRKVSHKGTPRKDTPER